MEFFGSSLLPVFNKFLQTNRFTAKSDLLDSSHSSVTPHVILGKLFNLSKLHFPHVRGR